MRIRVPVLPNSAELGRELERLREAEEAHGHVRAICTYAARAGLVRLEQRC